MSLPEFDRPPLVETHMGIQFRPLPRLRLAHLGAFWGTLGPGWSDVTETPAIGQTSEPTGLEPSWLDRGPGVELSEEARVRLRASNPARDRMIQVENGWFVYNWRKTKPSDEYPRYKSIRTEFDECLSRFQGFLQAGSIGTIETNLWEVGYINFVRRGSLWDRVGDWSRVLPQLLAPDRTEDGGHLQTLDGRWVWALDGGKARLQLLIEHGRSHAVPHEELLVVRLIARGQTADSSIAAARAGLDRGHEAIVRKFTAVTSDEARNYWGYRS